MVEIEWNLKELVKSIFYGLMKVDEFKFGIESLYRFKKTASNIIDVYSNSP
jgi:hypothetical protein